MDSSLYFASFHSREAKNNLIASRGPSSHHRRKLLPMLARRRPFRRFSVHPSATSSATLYPSNTFITADFKFIRCHVEVGIVPKKGTDKRHLRDSAVRRRPGRGDASRPPSTLNILCSTQRPVAEMAVVVDFAAIPLEFLTFCLRER